MAMFLPLVLAAAFIRNVNKLSYLTSVGNAVLGVGLAIILQYLIVHLKSPTRLPTGASLQSILIAFGQFVYGFEGVALVCTTFFIVQSNDFISYILVSGQALQKQGPQRFAKISSSFEKGTERKAYGKGDLKKSRQKEAVRELAIHSIFISCNKSHSISK